MQTRGESVKGWVGISSTFWEGHIILFSTQTIKPLILIKGLNFVHCLDPVRWERGNTSATSLAVKRLLGKHLCSELMSGCTLVKDPSSATGFSVGNVSRAVTSCRGTPGRTQVLWTQTNRIIKSLCIKLHMLQYRGKIGTQSC